MTSSRELTRGAPLRVGSPHSSSTTNGDGVADRIVNGTWDAEMNLGLGLRHTPATFTATR